MKISLGPIPKHPIAAKPFPPKTNFQINFDLARKDYFDGQSKMFVASRKQIEANYEEIN